MRHERQPGRSMVHSRAKTACGARKDSAIMYACRFLAISCNSSWIRWISLRCRGKNAGFMREQIEYCIAYQSPDGKVACLRSA